MRHTEVHAPEAAASAASDGRPRLMLSRLVGEAVVLFVAMRLGLSLLGALMATRGVPSPCHFEEALAGWQTMPELLRDGPAFPLAGVWERWDACWYAKIATYGYEPGERSVAFFPLFPLAERVVGTLTSLPYAVAGMLVSAAAYVAAIAGLLRLVESTHGVEVARRSALLLSIFPAAFYLLAPFTEALFLSLAIWSLVLARSRRWALAAACALLAGLTRPQGLLLALPLAWEAVAAVRSHGPRWPATLLSVLSVLAPLAAFVGYAEVARALTGETPYDAQSLWGGTDFHPPWAVVAASVTWIVERGDGMQAVNLATLLGAAVVLILGARRMPLTYSLYAWPPLLLIATRIQPTPLTSTTRYVLVLFPIFVVLALLGGRPWFRRAWVAISLIGLGVLATMFLQGDFVA
jgi:Mannosyltransferase (PIG-V)